MASTTSSPERFTEDADGISDPEPIRRPTWIAAITTPRIVLGFALLIVAVAPIVLAGVSGSLSIPHNDAWAYSRIGQEFGRTGEIRLLGWNRSALVGQIVVLGPLAASITAQHVFVALLAGVAVLGCYDLLIPALGRLRASLAALVLAVWPELGLLSTSFMSDVPALAATLGCLALARRALTGPSLPLLAASLAVGLWGTTIREQVLAAPAAVLLTALTQALKGAPSGPASRGAPRRRALTGTPPGGALSGDLSATGGGSRDASRRGRGWAVVGLGVLFAVGFVAFEWWRRSLAGDDPPVPRPAGPVLPDVLDVTVRGYFLLALAVSPAVLAVARPWRWSGPAWLASAGTGAVAILGWHDYRLRGFLMSDYLLPGGPYPGVFRGEREMLVEPVLQVLALLTAASGVLLAGLIVRRARRLAPLLRWFLLLTVAGLVATRAAGQAVFGRYLIVLVPVLLFVVLSGRREPRVGWSGGMRRVGAVVGVAAGGFLAVLALTVTAYGSALDAARWHAAERLVADGVPATDVDAGFEWSGYHSPDGVNWAPADAPRVNWYANKFADNRPCFVLASSAQTGEPGWQLVGTRTYRAYVVTGTARIWVYRTGHCRPPA